MKKSRQIIVFVVAGLLMAAAGGGGVWWWQSRQAGAGATAEKAPAKPPVDKQEYKYITLDKVIVMLRNQAGEPMSHYLAVDLVFKTAVEKEKIVKEHLPLLRSIAVKALSAYTLDKAIGMTIEQFSADINAAYQAGYAEDHHEKPFVEALIGKLIIE
jgi:flagellar FliL protein